MTELRRDAEVQSATRALELRGRLLELHQAIIDWQRREFERAHGPQSAGRFLESLLHDPALSWISPFTALLVELEAHDAEEAHDAQALGERVRGLLDPETGFEFQRHYIEALQGSADVVMAHAAVQQLLPRPRRTLH